MKKSKTTKKNATTNNAIKQTAQNAKEIHNGLSDVVLGNTAALNPQATALSGLDPIFFNNRWALISNMRQVLSQMYCEHGLIQALIDVPVEDAFRGGFSVKTDQLSEEEIDTLQYEMEKEGVYQTIAQTFKWNRLFGGAGIVIMTGQEHDKPLNRDDLDPMELRSVDMWELFHGQQNTGSDADQSRLEVDTMNKDFCYDYYGKQLHNTRVLISKGVEPPSFVRPRLRGWGLSVVEAFVQSLNQHLKTKNLTYEVLDEFKLDIFKIKGFNQALITPDGVSKITRMINLINTQKNYQNAITMDMEDDHQSKQLNFAGISEVMREIKSQIACDLRMPMTKLFGISSAGFNSGEDDIENYNAMVESTVRTKAKKIIIEVVRLYCQKLFGMSPSDLQIEFVPLRILSTEQEEGVKSQRMNRIVMALDKGLCSAKEAKESINREDLLPVKVDVDQENVVQKEGVEGEISSIPTKSTTIAKETPEAKV